MENQGGRWSSGNARCEADYANFADRKIGTQAISSRCGRSALMKLDGIHHLTAIASNPAANAAFYTEVLGLRLIKKTVNFDDPSTYHLYYGDAAGTPGTILTFFPWPNARRGTPGVGQVTAFAVQVPTGSLQFWCKHLGSAGLSIADQGTRFGENFIAVQDPDEFVLRFIETGEAAAINPARGATIRAGHALKGIPGATLSLVAPEQTGTGLAASMW